MLIDKELAYKLKGNKFCKIRGVRYRTINHTNEV